MTLKLTPAQFAAPSAVARSLAVCIAMALAVALGCGGGGSQTPILASAERAVIVDVSSILESSEIPFGIGGYLRGGADFSIHSPLVQTRLLNAPAEWKEELRNYFEDDEFTPTGSISMLAHVNGLTYNYRYIAGSLDFAAYRNKIYDDGAKQDGDVWNNGSTAHAILEDRDIVILGDEEPVNDVLSAFDSGEGFLVESSPLKRALDKAGGGLVVGAYKKCEDALISYSPPSLLSGCEAVAEAIKGGDAGKMEIFSVHLFSDDRRAASHLDDLEEYLYEEVSAYVDADFTEIKADGEFVTYRATVYRYR